MEVAGGVHMLPGMIIEYLNTDKSYLSYEYVGIIFKELNTKREALG
jgi:hypothetical protein